jgi:hypothetical protein
MFFVFPSGGNRTTQLPEYVNISGRGHTHTHTWLSASARLPTTPLLYTIPAIQLLTTPTHTSPLLSSVNTSPPLHPTAHNHGYYAVTDYSSAAILSPGLYARFRKTTKKVKNVKNCGSIHTPRSLPDQGGGRCVQNVNSYKVKETHRQTFSFIYKIQKIQYVEWIHCYTARSRFCL